VFGTITANVLWKHSGVDAAEVFVKKPVAVYTEKVYENGDFSLLGIGT
jgi:hypothetical protein